MSTSRVALLFAAATCTMVIATPVLAQEASASAPTSHSSQRLAAKLRHTRLAIPLSETAAVEDNSGCWLSDNQVTGGSHFPIHTAVCGPRF